MRKFSDAEKGELRARKYLFDRRVSVLGDLIERHSDEIKRRKDKIEDLRRTMFDLEIPAVEGAQYVHKKCGVRAGFADGQGRKGDTNAYCVYCEVNYSRV